MGRRVAFFALAVAALASFLFLFFSPQNGDSVEKMSELVLQEDLFVMRSMLNEYAADNHKRPQALEELVRTGYLKSIPIDPMTKRIDSWVVEWSNDPKMPGIINIHSGCRALSSKGTAYRDW